MFISASIFYTNLQIIVFSWSFGILYIYSYCNDIIDALSILHNIYFENIPLNVMIIFKYFTTKKYLSLRIKKNKYIYRNIGYIFFNKYFGNIKHVKIVSD